MRCPKCSGLMVHELSRWHGEGAAEKCLICGNRIWLSPEVVMPKIPPLPVKNRVSTDGLIATRAARLQRRKDRLLVDLEIIHKKEMLL